MKKQTIKYSLSVEKSPAYTTVRLQFGRDEYGRVKMLGAIEWTRANTDTAYWTPNANAYRLPLADMIEAGAMMGVLLKAHDKAGRYLAKDLASWRDTLDKIGAVQVHHDQRTSNWELLADLKAESYARWRDDNVAIGENYCTLGVLARDADEARALLILEARDAEHLTEFYAKWKAAAFPVRQNDLTYDRYTKPTLWVDVIPVPVVELKELAA